MLNEKKLLSESLAVLKQWGCLKEATNDIRDILIHLVTEWDKKQAKTKSYNRYALAQYIEAVDKVVKSIKKGVELEKALRDVFQDRMLDFILKRLPTESKLKRGKAKIRFFDMSSMEGMVTVNGNDYDIKLPEAGANAKEYRDLMKKFKEGDTIVIEFDPALDDYNMVRVPLDQ